MEIERTISEKGQIVIPKDVRDYLGLKPGTEVVFEVSKDGVILKPKLSPKEFIERFTNIGRKLKKLDIKTIKATIEEEYEIP